MKTNSKKLFTTAQNFMLIEKDLKEKKSLPSKKEISEFLDYWQDVYDIWKINNPSDDLSSLADKIKTRKELNERLGIRN